MRIISFLILLTCSFHAPAESQPPVSNPAARGSTPDKASAPDAPVRATEATKPCFRCAGSGKGDCIVPGCKQGKVECNGPCLRLTKGQWVHLKVSGHPPDELWQKFTQSDGHYTAWSDKHVGEVIEMQNGRPVHRGLCQVCDGTTRMKCSACKGTGQRACDMCSGKKVVPVSWTEFNNPKQKVKPTVIQLKDGRTLVGRIHARVGSKIYAKTEDGKEVELNASEIASEKSVQ